MFLFFQWMENQWLISYSAHLQKQANILALIPANKNLDKTKLKKTINNWLKKTAKAEGIKKAGEKVKEIEVINKIKDNIKEIFEQSNYSNILAVIIIRSFKFSKEKNEVIIVENPYCEELQLLKKIKELHAFSRTTNL